MTLFRKKLDKHHYTDENGLIPDLTAARVAFSHIVENTENRWRNGDIFFDGHDDFDLALDALDILDKLEGQYPTGVEETERIMDETWTKRFEDKLGRGRLSRERRKRVSDG